MVANIGSNAAGIKRTNFTMHGTGSVYAGTISQCVGNPGAAPRWQWRCGFYPGSRPGECTGGAAASFEEARSTFEAAWRVFLSNRTEADFETWREQRDW
jgi:hypothetical protein